MTVLSSGEWSGAPPLEPVKPSRINVAMGWRASYAAGGDDGGFGGLGGSMRTNPFPVMAAPRRRQT